VSIAGTVWFPPSSGPAEIAVVRITVHQHPGGPVLAEAGLPDVSVPPEGLELPFSLDEVDADPAGTVVVHAHADRSGSGRVETGDLVAEMAVPVDQGDGGPAVLELSLVE
jgi:hypothetical protein